MTYLDISIHVVRCEYYQNGPAWHFTDLVYPFETFYFVMGGDGKVETEYETIDLLPGNIYVIPANLRHSCYCKSSIEKVYLEAYIEFLPGMRVLDCRDRVLAIPASNDSISYFAGDNTATIKQQIVMQSKLLSIVSRFIDEYQVFPSEEKMRFKGILEDIERNITQRLSIQEIAKRHGWTPGYLSHAFHREFGVTLKSYMDGLLHRALCQELVLTRKTLKELAQEYSFPDAYYLSAFFKRHAGMSPSVYRKNALTR